MKRCAKCGQQVAEDASFCPNCGSDTFLVQTGRSGAAAGGAYNASKASYEAAQNMSQGQLVGFTILTIILPAIGGYFLIKPGVRKGFFTFAVVWVCLNLLAVLGLIGTGYYAGIETAIPFAILVAAGPLIAYYFRQRNYNQAANETMGDALDQIDEIDLKKYSDQAAEDLLQKYSD